MIRIGIVDDEEPMLGIVQYYIEKSIEPGDKVEVFTFLNGDIFLNEVRRGSKFDILFTDIQMTVMDGMELGREIKQLQPDLYVVFITSHMEYAAESYVIEAYQYILKQDMECRLPIVVRRLINKISKDEGGEYRLAGTTNIQKVFYRDIIYICKAKGSKYIQYFTVDNEYKERATLEQIFRELHSKEFILVERSYIVNMKHIYRISGNTIYLKNDIQVAISRARLSEVKKKINEYWGQL
ncbi:LytR/AlgR family response regulator transcription factor [Faecalicatena contorta]|uniref:Stage 0 sporulation protein A homolog n=1 Tax=Faecalicatena contorta TaxID=39482 RepID=A0A315ZR05_9FIRM|nr:LytTR family DNA-binding domain-containing protein [Faecalicatena contorta]PWJ47966.1 LytTR family two component transcriptional regulator [Faecalicatena contorta]SUQ15729.1 DNA-binding response regulator, LytR/AlgR family [Faecalicatena contorta]